MRLVLGAEPQPVARSEVSVNASDATLLWVDLDRAEAADLGSLGLGLPSTITRGLMDPSPLPRLRQQGPVRWVSFLGVEGERGDRRLADLDLVQAPGILVSVHSGPRPALDRLAERWARRQFPVSRLSETALALAIAATIDAYDELVEDVEAQLGVGARREGDRAAAGVGPDDLRRLRRQMTELRTRLKSERDVLVDLSASLTPDGSPELVQSLAERLESVMAWAQLAAEAALLEKWSQRSTRRIVAAAIGLVWATFIVTVVSIGLVVDRSATMSTALPRAVVFAAAVLVIAMTVAIVVARYRRWI